MERRVLVTGAGTLGTELAKQLLASGVRVRMLDHAESALWMAEERLGSDDRLELMLGDVRDKNSVIGAMRGVSEVIHTAALKHVRYTNTNPVETIDVNILGTRNLILEAMRRDSVSKFIFISSDKATFPNNIYGESKRVGEMMIEWACRESGKQFCSCRFGNYLGSSGSVIDRWKEQRKDGTIKLTDPNMRRFFIKPHEVAAFVIGVLDSKKWGNGHIYIPLMKVIDMDTMSKVVAERWGVVVQIIGKQLGEKYDEILLSSEEVSRARFVDDLIEVVNSVMAEEEMGANLSTRVLTTQFLPALTENEVKKYIEDVI
jgi:FlaA1/EpsC-like NDP-sugar epimerase